MSDEITIKQKILKLLVIDKIRESKKINDLKGLINSDIKLFKIGLNPFIYSDISQMSIEFNGYGKSACTTIATLFSITLLRILDASEYFEINSGLIRNNLRSIITGFIGNFKNNLAKDRKKQEKDITDKDINEKKGEAQTVEKVIKENPELESYKRGFQNGLLSNENDFNDIFNNVFNGNSRYLNLELDTYSNSKPSIYLEEQFTNINKEKYVSLIITKPPETIAVFLPPPKSNKPYLLFDSHSRSFIKDTYTGAYIKSFNLQDELIRFLNNSIFFIVDGMDNKFDTNAFQIP